MCKKALRPHARRNTTPSLAALLAFRRWTPTSSLRILTKHAPDNTGRPSRADVKDKQAKEQRLLARADAMKEWGEKLKQDEGMRVASGFKPKGKVAKPIAEESVRAEPWRIKEAIEHGYIKGDKSRLNETLYQFYNDFNDVADAFGIRLQMSITPCRKTPMAISSLRTA